MSDISFIDQLQAIIRQRIDDGSNASYTATLAASGIKRVAQKVGEEGVELALASVAGDDDEVVNEAADLIYHLLVLLKLQGLSFDDVCEVLRQRHTN